MAPDVSVKIEGNQRADNGSGPGRQHVATTQASGLAGEVVDLSQDNDVIDLTSENGQEDLDGSMRPCVHLTASNLQVQSLKQTCASVFTFTTCSCIEAPPKLQDEGCSSQLEGTAPAPMAESEVEAGISDFMAQAASLVMHISFFAPACV